jgi:hypothetical protein
MDGKALMDGGFKSLILKRKTQEVMLLSTLKKQLGQAMPEYIIVMFFGVMVLIVPDKETGQIPLVQLANALKSSFNAFAYALSFSSTITPL